MPLFCVTKHLVCLIFSGSREDCAQFNIPCFLHMNSQKNTNLKMSNLHMVKVEKVCIIEAKYHKVQGVETWLINYYRHIYTELLDSCVLALLKQHIWLIYFLVWL